MTRRPLNNGSYADTVFIVDADGNAASLSGGSGGGGDASAANQLTEISKLTSIDNKLPSKGATTAANSTPVTLANDGVFATNFGLLADSSASTDTGNFSLISLIKRILSVKLDTPLSQIRDRLMPSGTVYSSVGSVVSGNLKASAGSVYAITCSNQTSSLVWFQLFDKATAPVNSDTPIRSIPLYGTTTGTPGLLLIGQDIVGGSGISFSTGIGWAISSTSGTLSLTTANASNFITTVRWA